MGVRLGELARLTGAELLGDPAVEIAGAAVLADAIAGDITLVDRTERAAELARTPAAAAVVPSTFPSELLTVPALRAADVHAAFAAVVAQFRSPRATRRRGVSPFAFVSYLARLEEDVEVHAGATIADDVEIGAGATIHAGVRLLPGCRIGGGATIFPNAVLYENTRLGARAIVHAGAVLGAYGFGYKLVEGRHQLSAQMGWVQIGDDVEIGAGTTIDRGTYGPTIIGEGTKIDDQVMIAHNCRIGRHNMICSQVGIAGSTVTGDYVVLAGQVGVRDHVRIGTGAVVGAKAGVSNDVPADAHMLGCPATLEREQKLMMAATSKLPEMRKQIRELQRAVTRLSAALAPDEAPPAPYKTIDPDAHAA